MKVKKNPNKYIYIIFFLIQAKQFEMDEIQVIAMRREDSSKRIIFKQLLEKLQSKIILQTKDIEPIKEILPANELIELHPELSQLDISQFGTYLASILN